MTTLALARGLKDPEVLWQELQDHWRRGHLVGLAPEQEQPLLRAAVLGVPTESACGPGLPSLGSEGARPAVPCRADAQSPDARAWGPALVLGSGGSGGGRRWCLQPLSHLQASAAACAAWLWSLGIDPGRCLHLDALPLHHVSGLMPLVRSRCWGAELRWLAPELLRQPERLPRACPLPADRPVLLSLVPTQLQRLIDSPAAVRWLQGCAVIWVGGAALPADLAKRARTSRLALAPCYGATETAAMICALPPERFLTGVPGCGAALEGVELRLEGAEQAIAVRTARLSPGWFEAGRLRPFHGADGWWRSGDAAVWTPGSGPAGACIDAAQDGAQRQGNAKGPLAIAADGAPLTAPAAPKRSDPPGGLDPATPADRAMGGQASLVILARLDGAIHSGGETVFPDQVRLRLLRLIRNAGLPVAELLLLPEADPLWGERLVALIRWQPLEESRFSGEGQDADSSNRQTRLLSDLAALARALPPPQRPRRWLACPELEASTTGKWEHQRWRHWLQTHDNTQP